MGSGRGWRVGQDKLSSGRRHIGQGSCGRPGRGLSWRTGRVPPWRAGRVPLLACPAVCSRGFLAMHCWTSQQWDTAATGPHYALRTGSNPPCGPVSSVSAGPRSPWQARSAARSAPGSLVLLGVAEGDTEADARQLARKIAGLRVFEDDQGKMNRALADAGRGDAGRQPVHPAGRLPQGPAASFTAAAPPELAERLYEVFVGRGRRGHRGGHRAFPPAHGGRAGQRRAGHAAGGEPGLSGRPSTSAKGAGRRHGR